MPYLSPSSPPEDAPRNANQLQTQPQSKQQQRQTTATTTTIQLQQSSHRRARSANPMFSDEKGPGAFAPLPRVHRRARQDKKAFFQFAEEDDNESALPSPPLEDSILPPTPAALFSPVAKPSPNVPQIVATSPVPVSVSDIPFPTAPGSAVVEDEKPGRTLFPFPTLQRVPSETHTPELTRTPSTPIFLANGKPLKPSLKSSLSSPAINPIRGHPRSRSEPSTPSGPKNVHFAESDLESVVLFEKTGRPRAVSGQIDDTETETEGYESPASFSFAAKNSDQLTLTIDLAQSSSVPTSNPDPLSNAHLETIVFPRTRPPTLRGSILVKNVAFEKLVALRFTLDNWQTTSEVTCKYVCSLPSLPQPFPPEREALGAPKVGWDRFSFLIRLEDVERKLVERTIFLVVRYTATGAGEWWDNNKGNNYRLQFKLIPEDNKTKPSPLRQQQDIKRSPLALNFDTDHGAPPVAVRKQNPPTFVDTRPSQLSLPPVVLPPPPPSSALLSDLTRSRSSSNASNTSVGSLRLSNYVPPAVQPPPIERPSNLQSHSPIGPIVGGQPISPTAPSIGSVPSSDSTYAALVEKWCFHQSSPETQPSSTPAEPWRSPYDGASYGSAYSYGHHQAPGQVVG